MPITNNRLISCLFALILTACDGAQKKPHESIVSGEEERQVQGLTGASKTTEPYDLAKLALVASKIDTSDAPEKLRYKSLIDAMLTSETPVLALDNVADKNASKAQSILLSDPRLKPVLFYKNENTPLRNEVMSIRPAQPGDRVGAAQGCQLGECYRVDIYNFFHNITITGIVDIVVDKVLVINTLPETQPDLSERLGRLSIAIARHEPAVRQEIQRYLKFVGDDRRANDLLPTMASTKSALKNSLCERSRHLCVAPTYVLGDQALWVIVDLTDMNVVGIRWTTVGESAAPTLITERTLENDYVFKNFCEQQNEVNRNGWSFKYHLTTSDGLRIAKVKYNNQAVFESAKVVDWHVSYSREDNFGYSDATGCPVFSSAVVVAYDGPEIKPIYQDDQEVGFYIAQNFRQLPWPAACNYRYEERYEFYYDGRYRVALSNHGRGCGEGGTYRPVLRVELSQQETYTVQRWVDDNWQAVDVESWSKQPEQSQMHQNRYSHRLLDANGSGYLLSPSFGQFSDKGRGDDAYIYTTVKHTDRDEGSSDLVTLGSCCNSDYRQGPEQFMQPPEPLVNQPLVLWYVAQMTNDGRAGNEHCWAETRVVNGVPKVHTWPCTAGPMFVPITSADRSEAVQ